MRNPKWALGAVAIVGAAGGLVLGLPGVAGAHTALLGGLATCQSDGIYKATYNLVLSGVPGGTTGTFTLGSTVPADVENTVTGLPATHLNNGIVGPITVNGIAGDLHSTSLTVHASWSDGFSLNTTATISLSGTCFEQTPPTTSTTLITPPTLPTTTTTKPPTTATVPPQGKPITPVTPPLANITQEQQQVQVAPGVTGGDG